MILGVFSSAKRASAMRRRLHESERRRLIDIVSLAQITRGRDGKLALVETRCADDSLHDHRGPFPAMLRLMVGPTADASSFSRLHGIGDALEPDTSAIAAVIEHRWVEDVRALMEEAGADAVAETLKDEIGAALSEGRDLLLTAGAPDWSSIYAAPDDERSVS